MSVLKQGEVIMNWDVPSEVWFPALMALAGGLLVALVGLLANELNYRREKRLQRASQGLQEIAELQEILVSLVPLVTDFRRKTPISADGSNSASIVQNEYIKALIRGRVLTARIHDRELRRLSNKSIGFIQPVFDRKPGEEGWEEAVNDFGHAVDEFNERARIVSSRL